MLFAAMRHETPRFQFQDSTQTLSEAVAEYHDGHPGLAQERNMSAEAQAFFRSHDVAHVIFGCGYSLDDEVRVKISSVFGTTAGLGVLKGYRLHESIEIYRQLRVLEILQTTLRAIRIIPRSLGACLRQRRRWPWSDFEGYLSTPLGELRREFGIRVEKRPRL